MKHKKKVIILVIIVLLLILSRFSWIVLEGEAYCSEKTAHIPNGNTQVPASDEEKKTLNKNLIQDGKISLAMRELFSCERQFDQENKLFIFF